MSSRQPPAHAISLDLRSLAEGAELLTEAIVDTVRESLLILDDSLHIRLANRSFYVTFGALPDDTLGRLIYHVGDGQWNIPGLRQLLGEILPNNGSFRDFEVIHEFPGLGEKVLLLNARKLRRRADQAGLILLAIEDVTELREREQGQAALLKEKETLVQEIHHRVKNNLQMIVSLLGLHARQTNDCRVIEALSDASGRVQAIARLHETLYASADLAELNFGEYLQHLTNELQRLHSRPEIKVKVFTDDIVLGMETAIPLGLIANELILNCFKHAFPFDRPGEVIVSVRYIPDSARPDQSLDDAAICLGVQDNGIGLPSGLDVTQVDTMGFRVVQLLGRQLQAQVVAASETGLTVTVTVPASVPKP